MPKKRKLPKRPKQSASLQTWKNWEQRCKEVKKHNAQIEKDKKAKKAIINRASSIAR